MILDIPFTKVFVDDHYIKGTQLLEGFTEAYAFAVTCIFNRPHLFTVHTIDGAIYSRLPIWSLYSRPVTPFETIDKTILEPFGVIGDKSQVITHKYLKDYKVSLIANPDLVGRYQWSIEPTNGGFSEDPEQSKELHFIKMDIGSFALLPNNHLKFIDQHFANIFTNTKQYVRNSRYYIANG